VSLFSDAAAAAWVQAGGAVAAVIVSIVTIVVAVWIPAHQRSRSLEDARSERERQEKEHLRRLTAGLRAEIEATLAALNYRHTTASETLRRVAAAKKAGGSVLGNTPLKPGSMTFTDAVIYQQIAAELGRFPPQLISLIVGFYANVLEVSRLAEGAPEAEQACEVILGLSPRAKMNAALLVRTLEKFESGDFAASADMGLKPDEIQRLAAETGYPLDEVLKERGLALTPEGSLYAV
jgi:hypothetical protein